MCIRDRFSENVEALRVMIVNANKHTDDVDIKPGGFPAAYKLREQIMTGGEESDAGGLKDEIHTYMYSLAEQLGNLRDKTKKLAADYEKEEELNKLTADKLTNIMNDPFTYINQMSK